MSEFYFCYPLMIEGVPVAEIEGAATVDHRGEISIELISMMHRDNARVAAPKWLVAQIIDHLVDEHMPDINQAQNEAEAGARDHAREVAADLARPLPSELLAMRSFGDLLLGGTS